MGGRRLRAPRGDTTRPTAERVREALFSILGPPPEAARVLDLFAGAGSLGLEALSRGAEFALFIDTSRPAVRNLRDNIDILGLAAASQVQCGDARKLLVRLPRDLEYHWIFIDPPYSSDLATEVLDLLGRGDLLSSDVVVVVEHDRRNEPHFNYGCLVRTDHRRYGDTEISFYRRGSP